MKQAPNEQNGFYSEHIILLCKSYQTLTGKSLVSRNLGKVNATKRIFYAPFAVVSHDTSPDPAFNYANRIAMQLFETSWDELTQLPSRKSAELPNREERARQLALVKKNGFIDHYFGVRISSRGNKFIIENAVVWNLIDTGGNYRGQAATFDTWRSI